jgi:hypothetical protein
VYENIGGLETVHVKPYSSYAGYEGASLEWGSLAGAGQRFDKVHVHKYGQLRIDGSVPVRTQQFIVEQHAKVMGVNVTVLAASVDINGGVSGEAGVFISDDDTSVASVAASRTTCSSASDLSAWTLRMSSEDVDGKLAANIMPGQAAFHTKAALTDGDESTGVATDYEQYPWVEFNFSSPVTASHIRMRSLSAVGRVTYDATYLSGREVEFSNDGGATWQRALQPRADQTYWYRVTASVKPAEGDFVEYMTGPITATAWRLRYNQNTVSTYTALSEVQFQCKDTRYELGHHANVVCDRPGCTVLLSSTRLESHIVLRSSGATVQGSAVRIAGGTVNIRGDIDTTGRGHGYGDGMEGMEAWHTHGPGVGAHINYTQAACRLVKCSGAGASHGGMGSANVDTGTTADSCPAYCRPDASNSREYGDYREPREAGSQGGPAINT